MAILVVTGAIGAAAQVQQGGVTVLRGTPAPPVQQETANPPTTRGPSQLPATPQPSAPRAQPPRALPIGGEASAGAPPVPKLTIDSILTSGTALSDNDAEAFKAALKAADEDRWDAARNLVPRQAAPELGKYIDWLNYRSPRGDGGFAQIVAFLRDNPDWPEEALLRRQAEDRIGAELPAADVVAFFKIAPPQTSAGILKRLSATARVAAEILPATVRESWRNGTFRPADELEFLNRYRQHLTPADSIARFDRLIREGKEQPARDLLPLLPPEYRATADARIALLTRSVDAPALLRGLPPDKQADGRIAFEQVRYLVRGGDNAQAVQLLRQGGFQSGGNEDWAGIRQRLAREALKERRPKDAYDLAAGHGMMRGNGFAEGEFLAGFIALRFLDRPDVALGHFTKLDQGVSTPISKSRAAYWLGRTHEALKNPTEALAWYDRAAQHGQTYYGQLAAKKLPGGFARMPSDPSTSDAERQAVSQRDTIAILRHLHRIGDSERARPFLLRVSRLVQTAGEIGLTARLAIELGRPDIAVSIARRAIDNGVVLFQTAYPVVDLGDIGPIERALVLALIRQESNFQVNARSPVGAAGLMQLMPATAQETAAKLGMPYAADRLTTDPGYNVALGSRFLADRLQRLGGSYEMAVAAYNGGEGSVRRWLAENGDPRSGKVDMVDWVELIPFAETRNYVQRVMEGVAVYRDRLGGSFETVSLGSAR